MKLIDLTRLKYFLDTKIRGVFATVADVTGIRNLIPTQASSSNQLADKAFVNSTVGTNTAIFRGTFNSVAELQAYSGDKTNNDYAFVIVYDPVITTQVKAYDRYKYNGTSWVFEYELNNSSFTSVQWSAINSGITSSLVNTFSNKQDTISDLSEIRENAELGKEAYNGLDNKLNIIKEIEEDVYLYPGHYYQLADTTGSIDIALCEYDGYSNVEYTFFFVCEGTINFAFYINDIPRQPISPQWNRQFSPVSGKSYEVSISINNEGAYGAFLEF